MLSSSLQRRKPEDREVRELVKSHTASMLWSQDSNKASQGPEPCLMRPALLLGRTACPDQPGWRRLFPGTLCVIVTGSLALSTWYEALVSGIYPPWCQPAKAPRKAQPCEQANFVEIAMGIVRECSPARNISISKKPCGF